MSTMTIDVETADVGQMVGSNPRLDASEIFSNLAGRGSNLLAVMIIAIGRSMFGFGCFIQFAVNKSKTCGGLRLSVFFCVQPQPKP